MIFATADVLMFLFAMAAPWAAFPWLRDWAVEVFDLIVDTITR